MSLIRTRALDKHYGRDGTVSCEGIWARGEFNERLTELSLTPGPSPDGEG